MIGNTHLAGRAAAFSLRFLAIAGLCVGAANAAAPAGLGSMTEPHKPFQIFGNTYYVGTAGLSSVLLTSDYGHVLVDTSLARNAELIAKNIQELGFELRDVKAIVFSHAHGDHAGAIAELQKLTGAQVYALRPSEPVLRTGKLQKEDPYFGARGVTPIPTVERMSIVTDGQLLGVGSVRLRVFATPGHTPGSATWTWDACEGSRCLKFVYADSMSPGGAEKFRYKKRPEVVAAFEKSLDVIAGLPCELLLTPHPEAATLAKLEQAKGDADALADADSCKRFAEQRRGELQAKIAAER